ncbi:hypothetical protein Q8F55_005701 [Vanrija albida]|uniref:SH3 domain-containing protein n=1 Tax=Vanrija albida TaxID=181172 RepID=A0ABR3Q2X7_9TREE
MPSASSPSSAKPTAQRDDWTWAESQPLTPAEASQSDSVETRLGRLEAMVRDSQDAQAKLGDQLGQAVPLLLSRLEDIEGSLAKIDAGSLPGSHTGIPAHDLKLDVAQHLLENYQKAGEPLSSDGVGKLPLAEHIESLREDMILLEQNLEATLKAGFESNQAAVREAVQDVGVELDALLSRHAEVTPKELISSVEKSRQSNKAMLVVTSKRLKEVLDRLDHLESDLTVVGGQVSRLGTGADPSIMSVGDIAKEVELLRKNREGSGLSTQSEEAESPQADVDVDPLIETYSAPAVNHSIPTRPLADAETGETSRTAANDKSTDSDSSLNATQGELHFTYPTDDDSQRMDLSVSTFGPFSTAIIFSSGEVDMVLLDQYWWRCSRDGNTYTVREQVGPDSV